MARYARMLSEGYRWQGVAAFQFSERGRVGMTGMSIVHAKRNYRGHSAFERSASNRLSFRQFCRVHGRNRTRLSGWEGNST